MNSSDDRRVFFSPLGAKGDLKLLMAGTMCGGQAKGSRHHYLVHYIKSGKGTIQQGSSHRTLGPGDFFIHTPKDVIRHFPDRDDPWEYYWMGFDGAVANDWAINMRSENGSCIHQGKLLDEVVSLFEELLRSLSSHTLLDQLESEAHMRLILAKLLQIFGKEKDRVRHNSSDQIIHDSMRFMANHFRDGITINDVVLASGYERTYFSDFFHKKTGQSLRNHLLSLRITQACRLLSETQLKIEHIATEVGYSEYRSFSRSFKKMIGVTPMHYRREHS